MTDEDILSDLCRQVGIGLRAVQGKGRDPATVSARREIVRALREVGGWTLRRIAAALKKTERAVSKMNQR